MKHLAILFFICINWGIAFAQDTTQIEKQDTIQIEKEIPQDSSIVDTLNTEPKIDPTSGNNENTSKRKKRKKKDEEEGYKLVTKAYYQEGDSVFIRKVKENIYYPAEARQIKFEARLIVKFLVSKDSTVEDVQVIEGFPEGISPEFKQQIEDIIKNAVLNASPKGAWIAAQNNYKQAVAMTKKIPIVFLPRKED